MGSGSDQEASCTRNALFVAFSWMCLVRIRPATATGTKVSETCVCIVLTTSGATDTLCANPSYCLSQLYATVQRMLRVGRHRGSRDQEARADGIGYNKGYKICRHFRRGRY